MRKDIKLTSQEWSDLVFEGKNKAYGAYEMRQSTSKRHIFAFLIVLALVVLVAFLPVIVSSVKAQIEKQKTEGTKEKTVITVLDPEEEKEPEEEEIRQPEAEPPPALKSSIMFVVPDIADNVTDEEEMKNVDDVKDSKLDISIADVKGTDEEHGLDIADVEIHKEIAAVTKEDDQIFIGVEQNPQFPGGEAEMMSFISSNLKYPVVAAENGVEGRVTVRFVVNKNGEVEKVEILKGLIPACDQEAMRVVKMMPKWIPGKQNGRNVNVYYTLPIVYKLQKN